MKNKKLISNILLTGLCFLAVIMVGIFAYISLRNLTLDYSRKLSDEFVEHIETAHVAEMAKYLDTKNPDYIPGDDALELDPHVTFIDSLMHHQQLLSKSENNLTSQMRNIMLISVLFVILFMGYQLWLSKKTTMVSTKEREADERTRLMLDATPMICSLWDLEGNLIECNREMLSIFGVSDKSELKKHKFSFIPDYQRNGDDSLSIIQKNNKEVAETGYKRFEWIYRLRNDEPVPVELTLVRVPWKDTWRIACYARDLRTTKKMEENLKRVLALVEASPNMTMILGADGKIEFMNPAVSGLSGFSNEELNKGGLGLMFNPGDYERLSKVYIATALNRSQASFDMTITAKNGGMREIYFSVMPLQLNDGSSGVGLIGRDITELKLMQRNFEVAKDQAERALESEVQYNKAKGDFLSRVSHELRTPLNAIIGVTEMARSINKEKEMDNCCTKIMESSHHLLGLVNDILDMTGFDTDRFSFMPKPFHLRDMLNSVIDHVSQMAKSKEQAFVTDIDSEIPDLAKSDQRRLKQVLMNLLSNAVKFTPEKGVIKFCVRMLRVEGNDFILRFEVIDNGIGISSGALERLWQVFEQADNSITREHGGMGLGLSLTKRIVEVMQGELLIESEPGKGSHFTCDVKLGIFRESAGDSGRLAAANDVADEANACLNLTGKRILIVDDVEINREILIAMMEETGAAIDEAGNGEEAVNKFLKEKYDLVLMDLHMPVMDGFSATKKIRASGIPWACSIPIISISAETSTLLHKMNKEAGIDDHIAKPVDIDALFGKISKLMRKAQTTKQAVA